MKSGRVPTIVVSGAVLAVILAFWRPSSDVFDATKATLMWLFALVAVPILSLIYASKTRDGLVSELKSSWHLILFILVAAGTSIAASDFLQTSIFGEPGRFTSLATLSSGFVLFLLARQLSAKGVRLVVVTLVAANFISGLYVLMQASGNDPYQWQSGSFSDFVFGTMGNPNFATVIASCSACLSVSLLIDPSSSRLVRTFSGASVGLCVGMIGIFDSFQGNVALLPILIFSILFVFVERHSVGWVIAAVAAPVLVLALSFERFGAGMVIGFSLAGALAAFSLHPSRSAETLRRRSSREGVKRAGLWLGLSSVVVIVAVLVLRNRLTSGFTQGFVERGDFYRAAWEGIKDRPILGFGLDTFGRYFTQYRPLGHALNLEGNRTSSVHSVYLGMMFTGGILLFLAFMIFVTRPVVSAIRTLRSPSAVDKYLLAGLLSGFVSLLITFLVSTEHVAIYAVFFVLAGCLSGQVWPPSAPDTLSAAPKRHRRRHKEAQVRRQRLVVAASLLVAVALVPSALRPMRAARLDYLGQVAFFSEDYPLALDRFQRSSDLAPWIATYQLRAAEMAANLQIADVAQQRALQVATQSNFVGVVSVKSAKIVALTRDLESAITILENTYKNDRYALGLGSEIQDVAKTIAEVAEREGFAQVAERAGVLIEQVEDTRDRYGDSR